MTKRLILQLRREKGTAYGLLSMSFFLRGKFNNSTTGLHTGYASMTSVQLVHPIIEGYLLWLPTLPAHTDIRKPNSVLSGLWFIISKEFCKEIFLCVHEYNPENYGLGYNCTIPSPLQNPCGAHTAHKALCMHYRVLLSASHKAPALWALMLLKSLTDVWHSELPSASPSSSPCCLCVPLGFQWMWATPAWHEHLFAQRKLCYSSALRSKFHGYRSITATFYELPAWPEWTGAEIRNSRGKCQVCKELFKTSVCYTPQPVHYTTVKKSWDIKILQFITGQRENLADTMMCCLFWRATSYLEKSIWTQSNLSFHSVMLLKCLILPQSRFPWHS